MSSSLAIPPPRLERVEQETTPGTDSVVTKVLTDFGKDKTLASEQLPTIHVETLKGTVVIRSSALFPESRGSAVFIEIRGNIFLPSVHEDAVGHRLDVREFVGQQVHFEGIRLHGEVIITKWNS